MIYECPSQSTTVQWELRGHTINTTLEGIINDDSLKHFIFVAKWGLRVVSSITCKIFIYIITTLEPYYRYV